MSVVEPLLTETTDKLSSVQSDLVLLTLQHLDESVAPTLTPSCREMKLLINLVKSQRQMTTNDMSLASAAAAQVSV